MSTPHTVVIGSGLAGLSAAIHLVDAGHQVTVLEREDHIGGRTANWSMDGMEVETGLHRYLGFYKELPRLLRHVGVSVNDVVTWTNEVEFRIPDTDLHATYSTSAIHRPLRTVASAINNNHYLGWGQKFALAHMIASGVKDYLRRPGELDNVSVETYARRCGVRDTTVERILYPLTEGLFFVPPHEYSMHNFMGILVPYWNSVVKTRVGSFRGGMTDVMCEPLADYARSRGATFHVSTPARALMATTDAVTGVTTDSGDLVADNVVLAASLGAAKSLVNEPLGEHPFFAPMLELDSTPSVCFQVELDQPCLPSDHATFAPGTVMASFAEQSRTTFAELDGRLSIIMAKPRELLDLPPETLMDRVTEDARRVGIDLDGHIVRYRKVVVADDFYSLATGNAHLRPEQRTPISGLALAGDYTRQRYLATMEGAVVSGQRAAAAVTEG